LDARGQLGDLVQREPQALSSSAYRSRSFVVERCLGVVVRQQCSNTLLADQRRKVLPVLRIDLHEQRVHVTAQVHSLCLSCFAFGNQQIQQHRLIFGTDARQLGGVTQDQHCDGLGIEWITLAAITRLAPARSGPPWIDLVNGFTSGHQALRQAAAIVPSCFNPPMSRRVECRCPGIKCLPSVSTVRPAPLIDDPPCLVESDGHM
jgi:hypothetical protein